MSLRARSRAMMGAILFMRAGASICQAQDLAPWASNRHPTDVPRRHVERVTATRHEYTITQRGTMDGQNCRSPMGCGMCREGAIEQTWQSNRAVRMENTGSTDVVNPWLSNGRNLFRSLDEIVASAVTPGMSDREKARALWFQQIQHRFHRAGNGRELGDPVKVFNVYGHNPCGCDANLMGGLWAKVGIKGGPVRLIGHAIAQAFYDGGWHVMDADLQNIFLLRDNETVAGDQALARDHDLIKRTHSLGVLLADRRSTDEGTAAMFVCEEEVKGRRRCYGDTTMNMVLRPGEAITWRWGHLKPTKYMWPKTGPNYPDTVNNGLWEYRPDFTRDLWKKGTARAENVKSGPEGLAAEDGKTGTIVWKMRSPYVFVGGRLETEAAGDRRKRGAEFSHSWDGKKWHKVGANLDSQFPLEGASRYQYQLRCQLSGGATLKRLTIINDLQMALLTLPEMVVGENTFTYTDKSPGRRKVRITHEWVERSTSKPPRAPPGPLYPPDRGESNGTDIVFRWNAPKDPDGDRIVDYHFELSDRQDVRWPLSMSFYKLISRTADKGKAQYTLRYAGLLTPDKKYYWHVRAKDEKGVWGPWSRTWSFTPRGPAYPVALTMDYDAKRGTGVLRWKPNKVGRTPAKYRVYGSDEKGFSVSDTPYKVFLGKSKTLRNPFPANFIAETSKTELQVVGMGLDLPDANKAYYRVVAVDRQGKRSWSSDYVEAPRPFIYSKPAAAAKSGPRRGPRHAAKVGQAYRHEMKCIRSLGDLRCRNGYNNKGFWDIEQPVYRLTGGPGWLKVDSRSGVLSGTPGTAGDVSVVVTTTIDIQVRKLDVDKLGWGQEKVIGTSTRRVGSATQEFVIHVRN